VLPACNAYRIVQEFVAEPVQVSEPPASERERCPATE
jgi:hypothetical protein